MSELLQLGATILCPHGGQAMPAAASARVQLSGQGALTIAHLLAIGGCPNASPAPCASLQWLVPAARVRIDGSPAILASSVGVCIGTGPQGPPQILARQMRVRGQ